MRAGGARDGLDVIEMFIFCSLTSALTLALTFSCASTLDGGGEMPGMTSLSLRNAAKCLLSVLMMSKMYFVYTQETHHYIYFSFGGKIRLDSCTILLGYLVFV